MKVERIHLPAQPLFQCLDQGDVFRWGDELWMKCDNGTDAVRLTDGTLMAIPSGFTVTAANGKFVEEEA